MFFRQRAAENATLSYFFGCTGIGRSVAVDVVVGDEDWFIEEAAKVGVPISYVIDTHVHADHCSGGLAGREREMAAQLHDTLHRKLLTLPTDLEIYPGHQAGSACGAGLSGKPASTIGFEKRCNPMLSMSREAFVEALVAEVTPQPPGMAAIIKANLRGVSPEATHA